jgi:hypothetical protein
MGSNARTLIILLSVFTVSTVLAAQTNIPPGTMIPVVLNHSLDTKKSKPGQVVTADVMQEIPLDKGAKIKAGARVIGEVVAVTPASGASSATMTLRFDRIKTGGQVAIIRTDLRALASPLDVSHAERPNPGDDKLPPWFWTTEQIGGDMVYRGGGPVASGVKTVGTPVPGGVLARVTSSPGDSCQPGNDRPQALWVFSHDVCGVYGFEAEITHASRTNSVGRIVITSKEGNLKFRAGTGLLLQVIGDGSQTSDHGAVSE